MIVDVVFVCMYSFRFVCVWTCKFGANQLLTHDEIPEERERKQPTEKHLCECMEHFRQIRELFHLQSTHIAAQLFLSNSPALNCSTFLKWVVGDCGRCASVTKRWNSAQLDWAAALCHGARML